MAEGKMHFAPVLALDTGDFVVIGDRVVKVDNTPRDDVDGAFLSIVGTTFSHRSYDWKRVSARFSTNAMIPRLDDDFNLDVYTINNGRVFELDRWPDEPMIPHGMSVSLTAPAAFRFTFEASPDRHLHAAHLLAPDAAASPEERNQLPDVLAGLMRDIGLPNGIGAVGYEEDDIPALVDGSLKQQRLLTTAPREVTDDDLTRIFQESVSLW